MSRMNKLKLLAFYLPQYHTIPENDLWWGKGFTDWVNVKKSKPLYEGHYQPRIPLNNNYYDLSDVSVLIKQAELAKEFGLYGFCYYYYWFNGKKLLEKPLEAMLNNKNVNIPFCLSWANDPWTRAWDGGTQDFLMKQEYGTEENWIEHINYLIPFFRDPRYIKIEDMPILLLYRTKDFSKFDEMIILWNKIMKQNNLNELYIIETLNSFQAQPYCKLSKAVVEFEPMITLGSDYSLYERTKNYFKRHFEKPGKLKIINYDYIWKKIIRRKKGKFLKGKYNKILLSSGFVNWDNTPRKKENGVVFKGATPEKFQYYMQQLIRKSQKTDSELLFINSWNEWAEGCYLEPDENKGYDYLIAIRRALESSRSKLNDKHTYVKKKV